MSRWFRDRDAERRAVASEQAATELRTMVTQLLEQNRELVQQVASMKRDGFDAPPVTRFEAQPDRFTEDVRKAISQRASPRSREWAHLESVAADMLAKGEDAEAIAQAILLGEDPDDLY